MIYLDSCAIVKLVRDEAESGALRGWLDDQGAETLVTSELAEAEVRRAIRRAHLSDPVDRPDPVPLTEQLDAAAAALADLDQLVVERTVLVRAGDVEHPAIRTLDAIHLASAAEWGAESVRLVTYDRRLAAAARDAGFTVVSPS